MKKLLLVLLIIISSASCSKSNRSQIESEINTVNGSVIKADKTSEGYVYEMDYSSKTHKVKSDTQKLKDAIDRIIGSLPKEEFSDVVDKDVTGISDVYYWETPNIRILLKSTRSIKDSDQKIICIITEK